VVADAPASNRRRDKEMSIMVRLPIRYIPRADGRPPTARLLQRTAEFTAGDRLAFQRRRGLT
jgi:hypothetical protein